MIHAVNRLSFQGSTDPEPEDGKEYLEQVSWVDAAEIVSTRFWPAFGPLQFGSHDVHGRADRHLFHRSRRDHCRRKEECPAVVFGHTKSPSPDGAGSPPSRRQFSSRDQGCYSRRVKGMFARRGGISAIRSREGQALLKFAFLIPVIIILLGASISFGLFFFQANVLQQAVDVAAQEISRMPFAPDQELGLGRIQSCDQQGLVSQDAGFRAEIYDEKYLVIHDAEWGASTSFAGSFQAYADSLPLLNRLLVPVMIRDNGMTRYPGTIVQNSEGEETILIPIVEYRSSTASEISGGGVFPDSIQVAGETVCEWVAPVEEITVDHDGDSSSPRLGPYALNSGDTATLDSFQPGMVALRINYPVQATSLPNRVKTSDLSGDDEQSRLSVMVIAGDTQLKGGASTGCYSIQDPSPRISPGSGVPGSNANAGLYGLGELEVLGRVVRPYRKVMTVQAIYRREIFSHAN